MRWVGDLVGDHGAAAAGVVRPAVHAGLEEGAVDDELTPGFEQVEQTRRAVGTSEEVLLVHGEPRHPSTLRRQRVPRVGQLPFLHQELLAGTFPLFS
jgi:hypothetical protein